MLSTLFLFDHFWPAKMQFHVVQPKYMLSLLSLLGCYESTGKGTRRWVVGKDKLGNFTQDWVCYGSAMRHYLKTSCNIRKLFPKRCNGKSTNCRDRETLTHIAAASLSSQGAMFGSDLNSPLEYTFTGLFRGINEIIGIRFLEQCLANSSLRICLFLPLSPAHLQQLEPFPLTFAMVTLSLLLTWGDVAHWVSVW